MIIEEKRLRISNLFSEQKNILQNINICNYFDSISEIRKLELQKEIIKAIPTTKPAN